MRWINLLLVVIFFKCSFCIAAPIKHPEFSRERRTVFRDKIDDHLTDDHRRVSLNHAVRMMTVANNQVRVAYLALKGFPESQRREEAYLRTFRDYESRLLAAQHYAWLYIRTIADLTGDTTKSLDYERIEKDAFERRQKFHEIHPALVSSRSPVERLKTLDHRYESVTKWLLDSRQWLPNEELHRISGKPQETDKIICHVQRLMNDPLHSIKYLQDFERAVLERMISDDLSETEAQELTLLESELNNGFEGLETLDRHYSDADFAKVLRNRRSIRDSYFAPNSDHGLNTHRVQFFIIARDIAAHPEKYSVHGTTYTAADVIALFGSEDAVNRNITNSTKRSPFHQVFDVYTGSSFTSTDMLTRIRDLFGLVRWD